MKYMILIRTEAILNTRSILSFKMKKQSSYIAESRTLLTKYSFIYVCIFDKRLKTNYSLEGIRLINIHFRLKFSFSRISTFDLLLDRFYYCNGLVIFPCNLTAVVFKRQTNKSVGNV